MTEDKTLLKNTAIFILHDFFYDKEHLHVYTNQVLFSTKLFKNSQSECYIH